MFQWGNVSLLYLHLHRKSEIPWRWDLPSVLNFSARPLSLICTILSLICTILNMVDPYHYPDWRFVGVFSERLNKQRRNTLNVGSTFSKLGLHPEWKGGRQLGTSICLFLLPSCGYNVTSHPTLCCCPMNCTLKPWAKGSLSFLCHICEECCHSHGRRNQHNVVIPTVWDVKD